MIMEIFLKDVLLSKEIEMNDYKYTSHVFHFIMSILTGGLWLWVWLIVGLTNAQHNKKVDRQRLGINPFLEG